MKRIASALFVFFPKRNHHYMLDRKVHQYSRVMASAVSAEVSPQIPMNAKVPSRVNGAKGSTDNTTADNNRYIVTRNGILLPWSQIHQQYIRIDEDATVDVVDATVDGAEMPRLLAVVQHDRFHMISKRAGER